MVGELRASHVIHLHRLMAAVRAEFRDHGMDEPLEEYETHDVAPAEFKATKSEHERALMALSAALAEWAEEQLDAERAVAVPDGEAETDVETDHRREAGATR